MYSLLSQTQAPQDGPPVVAVAVVGELVSQNVAQTLGVGQGRRGDVYGGVNQPIQARGGQLRRSEERRVGKEC